jgi:peptidyl-prolyl cis-trans isomerase SurA
MPLCRSGGRQSQLTGPTPNPNVAIDMRRLAIGVAVLLMLSLPGARAQQQQGQLANAIVAMVNDQVITWKDLSMATRDDTEFLQQRYASQPRAFEDKMKTLRAETLERMIEDRLMLAEFKSLGRPLPESYVDNRINDDIKKYGDRLTLIKTLQAGGVTYESYREKIRDNTILSIMWNIKVPRDPAISPTRIENYYVKNQDKYKLEDRVKLRMIVLTNRPSDKAYAPMELAREIAKKIDDGASFSEMARVYSQGSQAGEGGDWGWVERKVLREDLAKAAFSIKPGQRSDPIETPSGVYLMLVEQSEPAHVRSLTEVRDEIENTLKAEEVKRLRLQYIGRLKKKAFIRYY